MGRPRRDIKNQKFGFLTAIEYCGESMWLCKCDCENYKKVRITDLELGKTKSCGKCGLVTNKKPLDDLSGMQFNDWTVIDYAGDSLWNCVCACTEGEEHRKITKVRGYDLKNNKSKSCGHNEGKPKIDMIGKQCGEWTVLSYAGNKHWNCRCSCNREKKVLGKYLRNGVSKSCGCLYGTNLKYTKDDIENKLKEMMAKKGRQVKMQELIDELVTNQQTTRNYIVKYGLESYIFRKPISKYELELQELFKAPITGDRKVLNGKELDLYFPEYRLAIEFNGNYWHSDLAHGNPDFHRDKTLNANKKGVRLIHIFEYEWLDENIKRKLINIINKCTGKININNIKADEIKIKKIEKDISTNFLREYHIKNESKHSDINIGCFYKEKLVGVMEITKDAENYIIERLCWLPDVHVDSGLNLMINFVTSVYKPKHMKVEIDISKFTGNDYLKAGFKLADKPLTEIGYVWYDIYTSEIIKTDDELLLTYDLGLEYDLDLNIEDLHEHGISRIYNCGNIVLEWKAENQ